MDKPNERSMHILPTVRGGGLIFIGLSLITIVFLCYTKHSLPFALLILLAGLVLLAGVSFMDDLYQLSAKSRFIVQCLVALSILLFMRPEQLDFLFFTLTNSYLIGVFLFFAVIWSINHFNFMDGLDGFCASQALFLLINYVYFLNSPSAVLYQDFCWILVLNLSVFLMFNFPPAKMFMGDVGSASLGLVTFAIAVIAQQQFNVPIVYWFVLNGLFLFDATVTLSRRILNKEKWFAPHRKHAYQRLKQFGWSARMILFGQLALNCFFLLLLLLVQHHQLHWMFLLLLQVGMLSFVYLLIERSFPMFEKLCEYSHLKFDN